MQEERAGLSRNAEVAKAMDYMLKRWEAFTRFLDDGRICLTNNAANARCEDRRSAGSHGSLPAPIGGEQRTTVMYTLIVTAKMNDVDPKPGLPTCWRVSPRSLKLGCTKSSPGTGRQATQPLKRPELRRSPDAYVCPAPSDARQAARLIRPHRHLLFGGGAFTCQAMGHLEDAEQFIARNSF